MPTPCRGEALSLPKLTQLGGSLNVERLRRSGRLRAAPTRCGGNRGLAGRQVGDPYVAHPIDNVFIFFNSCKRHGREKESIYFSSNLVYNHSIV